MNNDEKILKILEQQGKVLEALQADITAIKGVQQVQGEQLNAQAGDIVIIKTVQHAQARDIAIIKTVQQEQGKDIVIIKNSEGHLTTQGEAIFEGLKDTQATVKTIQAVQQEQGKTLVELKADIMDNGAKQARTQESIKRRVESLEEYTKAPKIHQN